MSKLTDLMAAKRVIPDFHLPSGDGTIMGGFISYHGCLELASVIHLEEMPRFIAWLRDVYGDEALGL